MSTRHNWAEVMGGLGQRQELALNTYKPFACGIVAHSSIGAAIQLRNANELKAEDIQSVALKVHPLVLNLMGKLEPHTGLEGKFSVVHAVAVALVTGRGGELAWCCASYGPFQRPSLNFILSGAAGRTIQHFGCSATWSCPSCLRP